MSPVSLRDPIGRRSDIPPSPWIMTGEIDEHTLVQAAQRGNAEAFNVLIDRYQALIYRIALRMLGDEDDADDAAQTAWITAFHKLNGFRGGQLRIWLARVVVNACYDEIRRRHRRRELPLLPDSIDGEEVEAPYWLEDPAAGVEETVEVREFEAIVQNSLQSLTPVYRSMLVLVDIEGMSYDEASLAAGVPLGTVRSRLARARMALRKRLGETADPLPDPPRHATAAPAHTRARCL